MVYPEASFTLQGSEVSLFGDNFMELSRVLSHAPLLNPV